MQLILGPGVAVQGKHRFSPDRSGVCFTGTWEIDCSCGVGSHDMLYMGLSAAAVTAASRNKM